MFFTITMSCASTCKPGMHTSSRSAAGTACTPAVAGCWQHACHRRTAAAPLSIAVACCGMRLSGALACAGRKLWHGASPSLRQWQPQPECCLALIDLSRPVRALEPLSSTQEVDLQLLSSCTPFRPFWPPQNAAESPSLSSSWLSVAAAIGFGQVPAHPEDLDLWGLLPQLSFSRTPSI